MTLTRPIDAATAWAAVKRRDRAFDGRFVTGVLTTRIYCRPSCAARHPARENVRFFVSGAEARAEGLRPCKRCLPDDVARDARAVELVIDAIRSAEEQPRLAELAALAGYSPSHFQRVFTSGGRSGCIAKFTWVSLARASARHRLHSSSISAGSSVTDAIYDAGYSGPSRFYDAMEGRLGMTPSAWVNGGKGVTISWTVAETSLGPILVAATDKGVCRLSFNEGEEALRARFPQAELVEGGKDFASLARRVVEVVERPGTGGDDIPLDVKGTAFQERIWQELRRIPPGETRSYAELAAAAGKPKAVRAAGSANGANNVAVLIPCHRVVRSDGSLGGYAYGEAIKRELLAREAGSSEER